MDLPFSMDKTIHIAAPPETVFSFFQDSARFERWWGAGSSVEPRVGGAVIIRFPNAVVVRGEYVEFSPPNRVVFTYGYEDPQKPIPPGGSRVTITLQAQGGGTLVSLVHALPNGAVRDAHVQGWRHQLGQFSNAVGALLVDAPNRLVDTILDAWSQPDAARRRALLEPILTADARLRETYGALDGLDEIVTHLGVRQQFFPNQPLQRAGDALHAHGSVLAACVTPQDQQFSLVLRVDGHGRVVELTGFARPAARA